MQEVLFADGANFAVAEEAGQAHGAEALLDELGVVIGTAKHALPAAIATAEASAINRARSNLVFGAREQFGHVFRSGAG